MNPAHRDAGHSVGVHLFQELSTLGPQVVYTLLLCQGLRGIEATFPARPARPRQPFGGARSGTSATVHTASSVGHRRRSTCSASAGLGSAPRGGIWISHRIAVFQPTPSMWGGSIIRLSFFHCLWKPFQDPDGLRSHYSLTTIRDIYIANDHRLGDFSAVAVESFQLRRKGSQ